MKKIATFVIGLTASTLVVSGCGSNPCAELDRPSQAEIAAANQGSEIEREVDHWSGEVECVVDQGDWVEDDE